MEVQVIYALEMFLSSNNQVRSKAQLFINQLPNQKFEQGIYGFLAGINSPDSNVNLIDQIAQLAALLLKKKYMDCTSTFEKIKQTQLIAIIQTVKNVMTPQKKLLFLKRCTDILVKIYTFIKNYSQLINLISIFSNSQEQKVKLTLMYLIQIICQFSFQQKQLIHSSDKFQLVFSKFLNDSNVKVRVATINSLITFLNVIQSETFLSRFEKVLPVLIQKCIECIQQDAEYGAKAISSLCQLIDTHNKFIKNNINDLIILFSQVMASRNLQNNVRIQALSGILSLSYANPGAVRKSQNFKNKTVQAYILMLSQIDNYPKEQWQNQLKEQNASKNFICSAAQQNLAQVLYQLGPKFLLPLFVPYISEGIKSGIQSRMHAALISIAMLCQGSAKYFENDLDKIMQMILSVKQTSSSLILVDIIISLAMLCQQFCPQIHKKYSWQIIQIIIKGLMNPIPKVQLRAIESITNFCRNLQEHQQEKALVNNYLHDLICKLVNLFEAFTTNQNYIILQQILNSFNSLCVVSTDQFSKYYDVLMPGLQNILNNLPNNTPHQNKILASTIQCIGFVIASIKNNHQKFKKDSESIMQKLINLQASKSIDKDDPIHVAIYSVYQQVSECQKEGFSKYCEFIIDRILESIEMDADCKVLDQTEQDNTKDHKHGRITKATFDFKLFGGKKKIVLNTAALQQKIQGTHILLSLIENIKSGIEPYIEKIIPVVCKYISFKNSRVIHFNSGHQINTCQMRQSHSNGLFIGKQGQYDEHFDYPTYIRAEDGHQLQRRQVVLTRKINNHNPRTNLSVL